MLQRTRRRLGLALSAATNIVLRKAQWIRPGKGPVSLLCLFSLVLTAGCASTKVSDRQVLVTEKLPRPAHIWVHDFAATSADVPAESALAGQHAEHSTPQTAEQIATGQKLGAEIATALVKEIRAMGMPAEPAVTGTTPQIDDLVIKGYLVSFQEGSEKERVGIGLGEGSSELKAVAEGFQVTAHGLRKLGSGTTDATGAKTPGAAVGVVTLLATHNPAGLIVSTGMKVYGEKSGKATVEGRAEQTAKEIAEVIKKRFQEQGWVE